ncbi:Gfo/Idh/MocA family protein [Paenibacillus dendritiformis]|uniref:Gfo/Idh/MocA family protein n=1 Tax=Paenibacillus dendritiformis TaxID=130049 RepID=UPI00364C5797
MTRLNFAIIGCQHAHIGIFIEQMLALGHRCAGIYEPENRKLAGELARAYDVPIVDDRELLLGEGIDVIGCAAVNRRKIDIIEACEQNGKPIMIDKPGVTNRADLERLRRVVERGRIEVGMLLTERFRPSVYTLKRHIDAGALGDIVSVTMRKPHRLAAASRPPWHFAKEQSGGIIIDLFIHDVDLLRWLTGQEIAAAWGMMGKRMLPEHPGFYDAAALQALTEGGIIAQLYADWHTPDRCWTWGDGRIFVTGTRGTAELRLEGDPLLSAEEGVMLLQTDDAALARLELTAPPWTVTEDFLSRVYGGEHWLTHRDLLAASEATIRADEQAERVQQISNSYR